MKNVEDILQWADRLILDKTGENLTSIEEAILTGVWSGKKYPQIATEYNCSESHVKKEAAKLWDKLREELGKDLNKYNFRSKVEKKHRVSKISHLHESLLQIDNVICNQSIQTIKDVQPRSPSSPDSSPNSSPHFSPTQNSSPIIDLTDAPDLTDFYNRTTELNTLKQWILQDQIRLITIYGLSGIGKSVLTRQLIEQIKPEFDYIIWKSLTETPTISSLKNQLQQFFAQSQQPSLPTIIDYFRNSRCLVILDDLQNLFQSGFLAGQYLTEHKEYGQFWQQIAKNHHQSCVILLSWEKPRELATLQGEKQSTRTLNLKGLSADAEEILKEHGLTDSEKWPELINLYQGHPTWLNIIASTILELFDGSVSLFLADQEEIFIGDLSPILESHLDRLSELEKKVISRFSEYEAVDISQPPGLREFAKSELTEAMQSLGRRGLVEKISEGGRSQFQLNPVFKQYIYVNYND
ncbi:NB-ARC domain-containing protein [Planktothricoides raciborskii]|uniref:ATPase n=1 Tax=Planktothricoides raciborskii FACHB-1370 TaxID=2949576 RepID=A0ABR8EMA8_9CYAN|nr:NB-ARC domain-containing protein [Planktothricoides raciborskii]MBD2547908.1 ATPase [Planktothricoides raciborskii FACHB-1370]MBD2586218.1 ATPase [Planktothricoides raciborskii FACHB-1261]